MKILISAEEIALAVRKNSHRCMIVEAIRRQVSHATRIIVDLQSIRWTDEVEGIRYFFFTPSAAQEALLAFDAGASVQPFEFELRKPAQIRPQGVNATMERKAHAPRDNYTRHTAPVDSELPPAEVKRQKTVRSRQQIKLRDTEREFGICRVREHPLKKAAPQPESPPSSPEQS